MRQEGHKADITKDEIRTGKLSENSIQIRESVREHTQIVSASVPVHVII